MYIYIFIFISLCVCVLVQLIGICWCILQQNICVTDKQAMYSVVPIEILWPDSYMFTNLWQNLPDKLDMHGHQCTKYLQQYPLTVTS